MEATVQVRAAVAAAPPAGVTAEKVGTVPKAEPEAPVTSAAARPPAMVAPAAASLAVEGGAEPPVPMVEEVVQAALPAALSRH
ncbi:hypothetical protein NKJ00_13230 [Mesorhizobium sp. M0227]